LLAYPRWDLWSEIVGIGDRSFGYHFAQQLHVDVADPDHPITCGVQPWDMVDETTPWPMQGRQHSAAHHRAPPEHEDPCLDTAVPQVAGLLL